MAIGMAAIINKARAELKNLTGLEISSTVEAKKEEEGWMVTIEVIEKHSIPDGMDILAIYDTRLDNEGSMLEFKRVRMRKRIDTDDGEA